jgi:hypothetical protein
MRDFAGAGQLEFKGSFWPGGGKLAGWLRGPARPAGKKVGELVPTTA